MASVLIVAELDLPNYVIDTVSSAFRGLVDVELKKADLSEVKARSFDARRGQIRADKALSLLPRPRGRDRAVYVVVGDGYVPGLNFVFGVAQGDIAVVFTERLAAERELFYERIAKEIIHELGHTFGLGHCGDPRCVMYFSNTVHDTDLKGPGFCDKCFLRLRSAVKSSLGK